MNPKLRYAAVLVAAALVVGWSVDAHAVIFDLSAAMDEAQADAGNGTGSPGTGSASVQYNDETGELSWNISWSGLLGAETAMHFHGPAMSGQNAGVEVDIGGVSGLDSPSIGSTSITPSQANDLLNDLWYINLHTDQFGGGEIRGQVLLVPEPAGLSLIAGLFGGLFMWRRQRGNA